MKEEIEYKLNEVREGELTYAELGEWFYHNGSYIASIIEK